MKKTRTQSPALFEFTAFGDARSRAYLPPAGVAEIKNSETDDFVGCIGTVRVLFMG